MNFHSKIQLTEEALKLDLEPSAILVYNQLLVASLTLPSKGNKLNVVRQNV